LKKFYRLCKSAPSLEDLCIYSPWGYSEKSIEIDIQNNSLESLSWNDDHSLQQRSRNGNIKNIPIRIYIKLSESPKGEEKKHRYFSVDSQEGGMSVSDEEYDSTISKGDLVCFQINWLYLKTFTIKFKDLRQECNLH
jgi:hypothetical protein